MNPAVNYVIDADALIHLWRPKNYPRSVFPSMWSNIEGLINDQRLASVRAVRNELMRGRDDLAAWAKANKHVFPDPSPEEVRFAAQIVNKYKGLVDEESETEQADPFLIARVRCNQSYVLVSREQRGDSQRPKIPYVCSKEGLACMDLFEMFEALGWRF
jgi:hypothetical protein